MSREIKFRAWHKEKKQMIDGSLLFWFKAVAESGKGESVFNAYEWMQYTGLKDKNGKEIYEGDIVGVIIKTTSHGGHNFIKSVVEYKNGQFQANFWTDGSTWVEVLGNIYETPELLEPPLGNNAEPIRNISEDDWRKDDR